MYTTTGLPRFRSVDLCFYEEEECEEFVSFVKLFFGWQLLETHLFINHREIPCIGAMLESIPPQTVPKTPPRIYRAVPRVDDARRNNPDHANSCTARVGRPTDFPCRRRAGLPRNRKSHSLDFSKAAEPHCRDTDPQVFADQGGSPAVLFYWKSDRQNDSRTRNRSRF